MKDFKNEAEVKNKRYRNVRNLLIGLNYSWDK
jgi:hypothetical protein